jgi:hypothetical protein
MFDNNNTGLILKSCLCLPKSSIAGFLQIKYIGPAQYIIAELLCTEILHILYYLNVFFAFGKIMGKYTSLLRGVYIMNL